MNKSLLSNIKYLGSATLINSILSFALGILVRNMLGPEQYGFWLTISIILTFTPLAQLGTLNAMNREVPFYLARDDKEKAEKIKSIALGFIYTLPLLISIVIVLFGLSTWFIGFSIEYKIGFSLVGIISFLAYLVAYNEMYYKSEQNFHRASKLISLKSIVQSVGTCIFVYFLGYIGLFLGMIFAYLVQITASYKIFVQKPQIKTFKEYKYLIKIGFPILLVGMVWSIFIATDRIIISLFLTPIDLGNYALGLMFFSLMMLFPQVISQVIYPKVVEMVSLGKYQEIKVLYIKVNLLIVGLMFFVTIISYLILPFFVELVMPDYIDGIKAARYLIIGIFPLTLVNVAACYFNSTSDQKTYLIIQIIAVFINIVGSLIGLAINQSIESVAISSAFSFFIYAILMNVLFIKKLKAKLVVEGDVE